MICCIGLIVGSAIGSSMGGPWTIIGGATGFGVGLMADMKLMGGRNKNAEGAGSHRGGCCVGGYLAGKDTESHLKDPVCGVKIEEKTVRYKEVFREHMYYFCSSECQSSFKDNPERYLALQHH